ncbi:MAG: Rieske (2Fe-2S) protein, partial [Halioglobus sp.]|nr:Rieske (2Fe-2S) protein [Halioglobus sp.]
MLQHLASGTTDLAESAGELDAREFTCANTWAAEREQLFKQTPLPVAFAAELPGPGAYLALDILDVPLLLTRDEQGELHAFVNACAHRGMPVATGSGSTRSVVCPFHGWAYNTDG